MPDTPFNPSILEATPMSILPTDTASTEYVQALESQVAILKRLLEVGNVLNAALLSNNPKIEALLTYIMDAAAEITGCDAASVLLWKNTTQELFFAATTSQSESSQSLLGKPVPLDSIAGTILRERRVIQVDDTESDPRHHKATDAEIHFVTKSLLGVPMISKDRAIGVLEVVNKRQLPWTQQDIHYLTTLAEEAAVVIEVAQLVLALQKANKDLSELDTLKNNFIAIASHELRTPLGVILGYASFLQEDTRNPAVIEHAGKVMNSALQLRRIIEDMVNLRYLKENQADLYFEPTALREYLLDIKRDLLALTDAKRHNVSIVTPDEAVTANIDRNRLSMALNNILNNAIAFTPEGGSITLSVTPQAAEVWIAITDTGVGMAKESLARVFDEFYQVEDHMTRQHGGLGIGLSIARALIEAHGGRIWAESAGLGKGATFTISLPMIKGS